MHPIYSRIFLFINATGAAGWSPVAYPMYWPIESCYTWMYNLLTNYIARINEIGRGKPQLTFEYSWLFRGWLFSVPHCTCIYLVSIKYIHCTICDMLSYVIHIRDMVIHICHSVDQPSRTQTGGRHVYICFVHWFWFHVYYSTTSGLEPMFLSHSRWVSQCFSILSSISKMRMHAVPLRCSLAYTTRTASGFENTAA